MPTQTETLTQERADLLETLAKHRGFLRQTVRGLTDEQAGVRPTASQLCLGGIIKHVALMEEGWADFIVEGPRVIGPADEAAYEKHASGFLMDGAGLADLLAGYDNAARRTDDLVASLSSLDDSHPLPEAPGSSPGPDGRPVGCCCTSSPRRPSTPDTPTSSARPSMEQRPWAELPASGHRAWLTVDRGKPLQFGCPRHANPRRFPMNAISKPWSSSSMWTRRWSTPEVRAPEAGKRHSRSCTAFRRISGTTRRPGRPTPRWPTATFRVLGRDPTDEELDQLYVHYLLNLADDILTSEHYRMLPGADRCLAASGMPVFSWGWCPGRWRVPRATKLIPANLDRFFIFGAYGSDSPDRAELTGIAIEKATRLHAELTPSQVFVVGDTPRDIDAAKQDGAVSVGVATGHFSADELAEAGADHVLGSLVETFPGL